MERKLDENENKELLWSLDLLFSSSPRSPEDFHSALRDRSELHVANHMASFKDSFLQVNFNPFPIIYEANFIIISDKEPFPVSAIPYKIYSV